MFREIAKAHSQQPRRHRTNHFDQTLSIIRSCFAFHAGLPVPSNAPCFGLIAGPLRSARITDAVASVIRECTRRGQCRWPPSSQQLQTFSYSAYLSSHGLGLCSFEASPLYLRADVGRATNNAGAQTATARDPDFDGVPGKRRIRSNLIQAKNLRVCTTQRSKAWGKATSQPKPHVRRP